MVSYHGGRDVRDCSLFMPKEGPVFRVGGGKIFKLNEKGGVFFKNTNEGGSF